MGAATDMRSAEPGDEQLPRKFDRYNLLKKLATGGMAEIYLAKQSGLEGFEKVVVLKRILSHLAQDEEFVSMFLDEARIAAKLSHPNIVQIYDLGKADGTYYIAMEYVSGRNVQHIIGKQQDRGEPIPVEHVCRIVAGVCDGLHYAHSRKDYDGTPLNIVHRDISPQNVLVSFAGGVKVVDFGIAKASTQLAQTRAGVLKGKYAYMSPEQVRGAKVDHRSDLFAVGLVFYEMLTGTRAFERDSSLKTLKAIVQEKPLNPRELNPEVPMEVVKLLSKALEKNPDRRYKTAQEMQLAIEDYLETSPKKSNNVRLSRYMYDLFDDELNSADGTMVVKGIGEVIIPASQGVKLVPRVEEEVDHKTLSAALLPAKRDPNESKGATPAKKDEAARLVRSEQPGRDGSGAAARPPARPPPAAPPELDDDDDVDGKTVPAYDIESYERERAARAAAKGQPPPEHEDEERTTAGEPPPLKPKGRPDAGDARAAALLAKVDAMAAGDDIATKTSAPLYAPSGATEERSLEARDGPTDQQRGNSNRSRRASGTSPEVEALQPRESMIVGPNGRIDGSGGIRPALQGRPSDGPSDGIVEETSDTPRPGNPPAERTPHVERRRARAPAPQAAKVPPLFYAALAAIVGLFVLSLVGIIVIFVALKGGDVEYGVAVVNTTPDGAHVFVDGQDFGKSPTQVSVPKGESFSLRVSLDGYKDFEKAGIDLDGKDLLEMPTITLEKN